VPARADQRKRPKNASHTRTGHPPEAYGLAKNPGRHPRASSQERRQRILDATIHLIPERGFTGVRLSDVGRRVGMSTRHIIYCFPTLDDLLVEAISMTEDRFSHDVDEDLARFPPAQWQLVCLIECSCPFGDAREVPGAYTLWMELWVRAMHDPELALRHQALDRRETDKIAQIVEDGQHSGELVKADKDAVARDLAALLDGLALRIVAGDSEITAEDLHDAGVRAAVGWLGFAPPKRSVARSRQT